MERAVDAPFLEITARGYDFAVQGVVVVPFDAADKRILPCANECLEPFLAYGEIQLQRQIAAAGSPDPVVGGATFGGRARVFLLDDRQRTSGGLFKG